MTAHKEGAMMETKRGKGSKQGATPEVKSYTVRLFMVVDAVSEDEARLMGEEAVAALSSFPCTTGAGVEEIEVDEDGIRAHICDDVCLSFGCKEGRHER